MTPFQQAMKFIAKWEWMNRADGAYTNDPKDPGGETKYGISKKANPDQDIKNITLAGVMDIYYTDYWMKFGCDKLPHPISLAAFDSFVQHQPAVVQGWLKTTKDLQEFLELRRVFYLRLIDKNPSLLRFKNGWLARLNDLSKFCSIVQQEQGLAV
jgi:lysozyme family protein